MDSLKAKAKSRQSSPRDMAAERELLRMELRKAKRIIEILRKTVDYFAEEK